MCAFTIQERERERKCQAGPILRRHGIQELALRLCLVRSAKYSGLTATLAIRGRHQNDALALCFLEPVAPRFITRVRLVEHPGAPRRAMAGVLCSRLGRPPGLPGLFAGCHPSRRQLLSASRHNFVPAGGLGCHYNSPSGFMMYFACRLSRKSLLGCSCSGCIETPKTERLRRFAQT